MNRKKRFSKKRIENLYVKKLLSTNDISKILKISNSNVYRYLIKYNIPIRSKGEGLKIKLKKLGVHPLKGKKKPTASIRSGQNHPMYGKKRPDVAARKGKNHPMYGKTHTDEAKKKISDSSKGRQKTDEAKEKIRKANKGKPKSAETKKKLSEKALKRYENTSHINKGKKLPRTKNPTNNLTFSKETKKEFYKKVRDLNEYKIWRTTIFKRDNFKCSFCDATRNLQVDHIRPFSLILYENKVSNLIEAIQCQQLWDLENGRVLCKKCHSSTVTYNKPLRILLNIFNVPKHSENDLYNKVLENHYINDE